MKIEIPEGTKHINILMSGGVDSTILLYLLLKDGYENIVCHTMDKEGNVSKLVLSPIIDYLNKKFNRNIQLHIIKKKLWIREAVKGILNFYPGVVITGCNKVVTDKFTPTNYIPEDTPPVRGPPLNEFHLRPLIDLDKIEIVRFYLEENILDLLKLTKSCGYRPVYEPRCNGCYFCMERSWAANYLGIEDPE